ncbi:MAG: hypothetical protein HY904_13190 [Deltaproteobacteria bacterium]|nr:hypothetical protein [Deltaproteobacteria bacterium]
MERGPRVKGEACSIFHNPTLADRAYDNALRKAPGFNALEDAQVSYQGGPLNLGGLGACYRVSGRAVRIEVDGAAQ